MNVDIIAELQYTHLRQDLPKISEAMHMKQ